MVILFRGDVFILQMIIFLMRGNNKVMKTQTICLIAVFLIIFLALSMTACNIFPIGASMNIYDSVVRIHIRANSNEDIDQEVKLKVRDEITVYLSNTLVDCKDKGQALVAINESLPKLEEIANATLESNNFDYSSSVSVKKAHFPEKEYDGYIFPEGDYDALIIELGEGEGDNWWCVAFPPLCFVPDSGEGEVVYRSWVKEILDEIFG